MILLNIYYAKGKTLKQYTQLKYIMNNFNYINTLKSKRNEQTSSNKNNTK